MNKRIKPRKEVAAAVVVFAAMAAWTTSAWAQLVVSDPPVETATAETALSVITGGGGGNYTPNSQTISNLDQVLFGGITGDNFGSYFAGWESCAPDCTDTAISIVQTVLPEYQGAIQIAQQQEAELAGENFTTIEQTAANTANVLTALQALTDATLQVAQEVQYERQLLATLITIQATRHALDLNTDAQRAATSIGLPAPLLPQRQGQ